MALSRLAQQFADEIKLQDWSDAPYRLDRAGHSREMDTHYKPKIDQLSDRETDAIRTNVMWVTAQVLGYNDPNFDEFEYAEACGVDTHTPSGRPRSGMISAGLRRCVDGQFHRPGTYECNESAPQSKG